MTEQLDLMATFNALSGDDRELLALVPDEEHRSMLFRELLAERGLVELVDPSVAENVLVYPELRRVVFDRLPVLPERSTRYVTAYGTETLRGLVADRLGSSLGAPIPVDSVFGVAGVSGALASIALGLQLDGGPVPRGSSVLLPAPFWQGFYWCFGQVADLRCRPVALADERTFRLTLDDLTAAYHAAAEKPRLLVLTNPQNPLGYNYDERLLESIYEWALGSTDMHIISDEMYCHSQLGGTDTPFVSALALKATAAARDRVHVVWGFAKDFGLSGFRAGFVISRSEWVREVMLGDAASRRTSQAWFSPYDSLKHFYTADVLTAEDGMFWDRVMTLYQDRLTESFDAVAGVLDAYGIEYVHQPGANSAQFFWLDLREFLRGPLDDAPAAVLFGDGLAATPEDALAHDILTETGVKLLTGTTLSCPRMGYYRLCFTATDRGRVVEAVERMCRYLDLRRATPDHRL